MNNQNSMMNNQSAMTTGVVPIQNGKIGSSDEECHQLKDKSVSLTPFQERLEKYRDVSKIIQPLIRSTYYGIRYSMDAALLIYMFGPEYIKSSFWITAVKSYRLDVDGDEDAYLTPAALRCYMMNKEYYDNQYNERTKDEHPYFHILI